MGSGVNKIVAGSTQIKSVNDIEVGNVVVIKSGGNAYGHIMLITDVSPKDKAGNVTWYKVVHAEAYWENAPYSGGGDVNETTIEVGGTKDYSKAKYEHKFYKWDTPDEAVPQGGNISSFSTIDALLINSNYVVQPDATSTTQPVFTPIIQGEQ